VRSADTDTIVACATPPGRGGIGIVRISGPRARLIATGVLGTVPVARRARFMTFLDGDARPIDAGLALYFPGPQSFTGEDVLELQGHGGQVVMDLLVARVIELGARQARPGEFTERAFLNDKLDLVQAEAIADLIDAGSAAAARAALRSLSGEFSDDIHALVGAITALRVFVEASIDFPDEDVEFLGGAEVTGRLADINGRFAHIEATARQGRALREGLNVVITGTAAGRAASSAASAPGSGGRDESMT
jgi:tRNA modification GTPase